MASRTSARLGGAVLSGAILLALAVGSHLVSATYAGEAPPPVRPAQVPEADRGRLALVGDRVPVARLRGTPFEVGRQHGALFRDQIRFLQREYFDALVVPAVGGRDRLVAWAAEVKPFIPAHYLEEMRGIAEGSGTTFEDVFLANTMLDLFQSLLCSTVVAAGDTARDGEVLFGRNLDFPGRGILHRMSVVLVFEPDGVQPVAAVTWPGIVGVLSGMNARGVCGATMLIHGREPPRPGMPYLLMYREALAGAGRTSDVGDFIEKAKRTCPNNFMVVDATGAAEVVEWAPDRVERRTATDGALCSTNHFRTDALADVPKWPMGKGRYRTLASFLEAERGRVDLASVQAALEEVATPWMTNVQSMVFLPRRREIHVSGRDQLPVARGPFVRISADALFGADAAGDTPRAGTATDAGR